MPSFVSTATTAVPHQLADADVAAAFALSANFWWNLRRLQQRRYLTWLPSASPPPHLLPLSILFSLPPVSPSCSSCRCVSLCQRKICLFLIEMFAIVSSCCFSSWPFLLLSSCLFFSFHLPLSLSLSSLPLARWLAKRLMPIKNINVVGSVARLLLATPNLRGILTS